MPPLTVVTVVEPGYGRRNASPPKSRIDASLGQSAAERVHHLGVADELERDEPERSRDVVVGDGVLVALDRAEDEAVDRADLDSPFAISAGAESRRRTR